MSKKEVMGSDIGYVEKCGGIPMYPNEYHFDMERPESISDEEIKERKKYLKEFLSEYNINLDIDEI